MLGPTSNILDERALVLNRSWMAITTTTVRRAIGLVYIESAHIICPHTYEPHDFGSWTSLEVNGGPHIRTVFSRVRMPEIIVLRTYDGLPKRTVAFSRRNLYRRDNLTCQYCGKRPGSAELTIDHVVSRSRGGRTSWDNCVLACVDCNKRKASRTLSEAGMRLLRKPTAPKWSWDVELAMGRSRDCWEHFIPRRHARNGNSNGNGNGDGH